MKTWMRRAGIALVVVVVTLVIALGGVYAASASKEGRSYEAAGATLALADDAAALAEGERLYASRGCMECHGADAGGRVLADEPGLGRIVGSNLTAFAGAPAADWDRAVRHGIRRDGGSLVFMPSGDYAAMGDEELARIVGYVRSLPRVERELPSLEIGVLARALDLAGVFVLFPASAIDHSAEIDAPAPGRTVAYGAYLARLCTGCHGEHFSGGAIPGAPPEMGVPPNLTPDVTGLAGWTESDLRRVLREGRTRDGHAIAREQMPWPAFGRMTDDEIGALWMFLQTLPPLPEGNP